jgi:low affinity Fe/Cu permease
MLKRVVTATALACICATSLAQNTDETAMTARMDQVATS